MKRFLILSLLIFPLSLQARVIKLTLSPLWLFNNTLNNSQGLGYGLGLNYGYTVHEGKHTSMEFTIANHLQYFPLSTENLTMYHLGFGLRVIFGKGKVRPYFVDEFMAAYLWRSGQPHTANALSVLLALGLEFIVTPRQSFMTEINYQSLHVGYFDRKPDSLYYPSLTLGWQFNL